MDILKSKKIGDGQFQVVTEVGTWEIVRKDDALRFYGTSTAWQIWEKGSGNDCGVPKCLHVHGASTETKKAAIHKISQDVEYRRLTLSGEKQWDNGEFNH